MTAKLQNYFPVIRTREEILAEIYEKEELRQIFECWQEENQQEFLDFCTGVKGVKVMYDFISKAVLDPSATPERMDELLSLLLGQKVKVKEVLPNEGARLADASTLVVMDMVVELADGSIANLEIQKIGYKFPGARSACYSADLLLRQYQRIRSKRKKKFSYREMKHVYTIILFENSPKEFMEYSDAFIHRFEQQSNTGIQIDLLQKYVFISLDMFRVIQQNENKKITIDSRLDAWLAFLSTDDPDVIVEIIDKYPDFKVLYEQIYEICRNLEGVMDMFSKELREMDRNTVQLMIDEMQEDLKQKQEELKESQNAAKQLGEELEESQNAAKQLGEELEESQNAAKQLGEELEESQNAAKQLEKELKEALQRISELESRA